MLHRHYRQRVWVTLRFQSIDSVSRGTTSYTDRRLVRDGTTSVPRLYHQKGTQMLHIYSSRKPFNKYTTEHEAQARVVLALVRLELGRVYGPYPFPAGIVTCLFRRLQHSSCSPAIIWGMCSLAKWLLSGYSVSEWYNAYCVQTKGARAWHKRAIPYHR